MEADAIIMKKLGFSRSVSRVTWEGKRERAELCFKCFCIFSLTAWAYRQRKTVRDVINIKPNPSDHLITSVSSVRGKVQRIQNLDELIQPMIQQEEQGCGLAAATGSAAIGECRLPCLSIGGAAEQSHLLIITMLRAEG